MQVLKPSTNAIHVLIQHDISIHFIIISSFHCELLPGPATHRPNATRTVLPSYKHLPWRMRIPGARVRSPQRSKAKAVKAVKAVTRNWLFDALCRFRDSFSICNTCSNRLWSHPFCCPYQVGVPVLLISDAHLTTVLLLEPQNFLQNLGLTRSDSPSCKMSNTVIQVHGNKQGSLVVSSSPHRQSSKRVKMHQLTKRSHQHRYLTLSPFANVHC